MSVIQIPYLNHGQNRPVRQLHFEKILIDSVILQNFDNFSLNLGVFDGQFGRLVRKLGQFCLNWHHNCHNKISGGVCKEANAFDNGTGLEDGFNLAVGDVLAVLKFYQIFLSVNDSEKSKFRNECRFKKIIFLVSNAITVWARIPNIQIQNPFECLM